jgi:hypothetical protein
LHGTETKLVCHARTVTTLSMPTLLRDELQIVVTEYGNGIWEWEICRRGEPLSARMRDGPFRSEEVALAAGKVALREFLELLEFEQESDA